MMGYTFPSGGSAEQLSSTSSSLLRRVRSGEADAWRRLVKLYGPVVFLWARHTGLRGHDAADVVQETFASVASSLESFRHDRPQDSFRAWLWTIARNKIRDYFRRQRDVSSPRGGTAAQRALSQIPEDASEEAAIGDHLLGVAEQRAVELIRAEFEDRTWKAFWLMTVEGRLSADVGLELGMTKRAVRQAKYRVLRRLREALEVVAD